MTGYGEYDARNQHHRFWANQLDPSLPNPPAGSVAGGPNVSLDDPVAADALAGCAPAFCYIDDIESWSTNEVTINWNAPLAWAAAFTADVADPVGTPEPSCTVSYLVDSQWDDGFTARVRITNTGEEPLTGWTLSWNFDGDQQVTHAWNTRLVQRSAEITATDIGWNGAIEVGGSESFGFNGSFSGTNASRGRSPSTEPPADEVGGPMTAGPGVPGAGPAFTCRSCGSASPSGRASRQSSSPCSRKWSKAILSTAETRSRSA